MKKTGYAFEYEPPAGWLEFMDGRRHVFQGGGGEELIVSGYVVEGDLPGPEREALVRGRLFRGAVESAEAGATHPELDLVEPLWRDESIGGCECWRLGARTLDGGTLFEQAVCVGERAVLLVTFESPNREESLSAYLRFLGSVRSLPATLT